MFEGGGNESKDELKPESIHAEFDDPSEFYDRKEFYLKTLFICGMRRHQWFGIIFGQRFFPRAVRLCISLSGFLFVLCFTAII